MNLYLMGRGAEIMGLTKVSRSGGLGRRIQHALGMGPPKSNLGRNVGLGLAAAAGAPLAAYGGARAAGYSNEDIGNFMQRGYDNLTGDLSMALRGYAPTRSTQGGVQGAELPPGYERPDPSTDYGVAAGPELPPGHGQAPPAYGSMSSTWGEPEAGAPSKSEPNWSSGFDVYGGGFSPAPPTPKPMPELEDPGDWLLAEPEMALNRGDYTPSFGGSNPHPDPGFGGSWPHGFEGDWPRR